MFVQVSLILFVHSSASSEQVHCSVCDSIFAISPDFEAFQDLDVGVGPLADAHASQQCCPLGVFGGTLIAFQLAELERGP